MNKKNILQNIIIIITLILLIAILFVHKTVSVDVISMYVIYLLFFVLYVIDIVKKNNILNDKTYSLGIILVCLLTNIILIRSMFDTNIISVGFSDYVGDKYQMMFLKNNILLIDASFILLLIYRLSYIIKLPNISVQINFKNKSEK